MPIGSWRRLGTGARAIPRNEIPVLVAAAPSEVRLAPGNWQSWFAYPGPGLDDSR